jgi:hypothetical protein
LPLRIGRASGSARETSLSVIFKPPRATVDLLCDLLATRGEGLQLVGRTQLGARTATTGPRARDAARRLCASLAWTAISRPARRFNFIIYAFASPVRRANVLEIAAQPALQEPITRRRPPLGAAACTGCGKASQRRNG